jgi:hypothetical protein
MRIRLAVTTLLIAGACAPHLAQPALKARGACPQDDAWARRGVEKFLSSPLLQSERTTAGITPGAHAFHVLTSDRDSATCARLESLAGGAGQFTFYGSDELFFAVGRRPATLVSSIAI